MKKIIISLLSIIFIISMITSVYAATGSINIGASSDTVIKGKTFTVTIAGTADSNITGMQSGLSYDTSKLSIESKSAGQGYFDASATKEIAIGSSNAEGLSKAGTLYTITFKVLDTASEGETKISFNNAILATVNGQLDPVNKEVTIDIKADDTTAGNQGGTNSKPEQNPSNGNNASSGNNNNSNSSNKGENKSENTNKNVNTNKNTTKKLPQTGVESTTLFAIIALAVVGITSFISYRKYKNI